MKKYIQPNIKTLHVDDEAILAASEKSNVERDIAGDIDMNQPSKTPSVSGFESGSNSESGDNNWDL